MARCQLFHSVCSTRFTAAKGISALGYQQSADSRRNAFIGKSVTVIKIAGFTTTLSRPARREECGYPQNPKLGFAVRLESKFRMMSGSVYDKAGHIVTTAHGSLPSVMMAFSDDYVLDRTVTKIGEDRENDIAVFRFDGPVEPEVSETLSEYCDDEPDKHWGFKRKATLVLKASHCLDVFSRDDVVLKKVTLKNITCLYTPEKIYCFGLLNLMSGYSGATALINENNKYRNLGILQGANIFFSPNSAYIWRAIFIRPKTVHRVVNEILQKHYW